MEQELPAPGYGGADTPAVRGTARRIVRHMDVAEHRRAYQDALRERDAARARAVVDSALEAGVAVSDVYLGILQPALYAVGHEWAAA